MDSTPTPSPLNELTPDEEFIILRKGTERPGTGALLDNKASGTYICRRCNAALYLSQDKFESHCGWPSFDQALPGAIRYLEDRSHGMVRTEVRCAVCDSHLGHRFDGEGYTPTNARYCINSVAMRLEPAAGEA